MSVRDPETDLATLLVTNLNSLFALGFVLGTDVKTGPKRSTEEPGNDVVRCWVVATGGPPPQGYLGGPSISGSRLTASLQVMSVGLPNDRASGLLLGQRVFQALHEKAPAGYVGCWAENTAPLSAGVDESQQFFFTNNFRLTWEDTN